MTRAVLWGALAFSAIASVMPAGEAKAEQQSCAQFRDAIIRMETESVRPPGWFAFGPSFAGALPTKINGHSEFTIPYPAMHGGMQKMTNEAIAQLDQKMSAMVR